jgi:tetrahydromethanopterin S-methyltransferase subunit G
MSNEELFEDLKQFIDAKFSQELAHVATKDDVAAVGERVDQLGERIDGVERRLDGVEHRLDGVDGRFDDLDEKLNEILNAVGERFVRVEDASADHERRITRLEHRAA